ncbi:MAG TPA: radical SAM protein [Vicinamibacterales bacterium]|nr:radical SAM protein [Vicinamibacterales bacterium]
MANIMFISLYDRNAYGLRVMSANLRQHGHDCHMVFLKRYNNVPTYRLDLEVGEYPWMGIAKNGRVFKYASNSHISPTELELLRQTIEKVKPQVIGLTVNTPLRSQAIKVTRYLKEHTTIPIIWGGYDPTVNASDCLKLCDYACVGEGDQTVLEIAARLDEGRSFDDVGNLIFMRKGFPVTNPRYPVEQNLDLYPWRDDDPAYKYFIEDDKILENYDKVNDRARGIYQTMSARGCPYKCTYCCEATFKDIYSGEKFLRRRSAENIVAELAAAKERYGLTKIHFDDEIFAMNLKWLDVFVPLYKRDVNLPFTAYIYPTRNIEKILGLLKEAGLVYCCLALESGSERINKKVFDRVYDKELFLHTAAVCKQLGIAFYTDVITYNPYEEEEDLRRTLDVLTEIGGGFEMCINKLFVLPGTKMAQQMAAEGKPIENGSRDKLFNYYCRLYWITSFTRHSKKLIGFVERMPIFRRRPELLNPAVLEFVLHPVRWSIAQGRRRLPATVVEAIQDWRQARYRRRPDTASDQVLVCR